MPQNDGSSPAPAFSPASSPSASSQTERDYSKETRAHHGRPQTPQHRRGHSEPHNAFSPVSPVSPPKLPSPLTMNLFRLGIGSSPLSPLRRQFSSSVSNDSASPAVASHGAADADDELSEQDFGRRNSSDGDEGSDDDLTQDSKDVLVDRLNDLLQRLSTGGSLRGTNITTLHAKVDEMEKVLASDPHRQPPRPGKMRQRPSILQLASPLPIVRSNGGGPRTPEEQQGPDYWGFMATPKRQPASQFSELSTSGSTAEFPSLTTPEPRPAAEDDEPKISSDVADRLVVEAEKLCTELNTVLKDLEERREESDHLHALLLDREECAAKRILELEDLVSVLGDEIASNKSDLEHLRLQLRAVEVLCYEYVPPDADPDLLQSIENWKSDYTRLKVKMAARRRERNPLSAAASPSGSSVLSPTTSALMERAGLR